MKLQLQEFNHFIAINEQLYNKTIELFIRIPENIFEKIPFDSDFMFLGTRMNVLNIGNLIRHLVIAESSWIKNLPIVKAGDSLPLPKNAKILDFVDNGKSLIEAYKKSHQINCELLKNFTEKDLMKEINFFNRKYTVIGFLWVVFGHRSYHLGQIDILARQQNHEPPEYMEWLNTKDLIA